MPPPVEHLWRSREWHPYDAYDVLVQIVGPDKTWIYGCFSATPDQLTKSIADRIALLSGEGMPSDALIGWKAVVTEEGSDLVVYTGFERLEGPCLE